VVYPRQDIPMVEKEGDRFFIIDLWRTYVPITRCAFAIIDHVLLFAAGSGKTILWYTVSISLCALNVHVANSTSILDELGSNRNKSSDIIACYYFGSEKLSPEKRNFRGLLTSLVKQLCKDSNRLPDSIHVLYATCRRNGSNPPSEAMLAHFLTNFLAELQAQFSIYIVIDGVDNCVEADAAGTDAARKKVLKFLEGLVRLRNSKLNICITSSSNEEMEKNLGPLAAAPSCRKMFLHKEEGQKGEITNYITAFVRRDVQKLSDDDKKEVVRTLSEGAGGK
jgi:hypothetical protein